MQLISQLLDEARRFAELSGIPLVVERSDSSEAVYLKTQRDGYWRGIRIAAHAPAHLSSADCSQILVHSDTALSEQLLAEVRESLTAGGEIVADPQEVRDAILKAYLRQPGEPQFLPSPRASEISALRHRLNQRAKWCYEEELRLSRAGYERP